MTFHNKLQVLQDMSFAIGQSFVSGKKFLRIAHVQSEYTEPKCFDTCCNGAVTCCND